MDPTTLTSGAIASEIWGAPAPEVLARALRGRRGFFYLDSARPEEVTGRAFSFLGFDPVLTWRAKNGRVVLESAQGREEIDREPLTHLRDLMSRYATPGCPELPFSGGGVGYFGYEFGARAAGVSSPAPDDPHLPDAQFGFYDGLLACDLAAGKTYAVASPVFGRGTDRILDGLHRAVALAAGPAGAEPPSDLPGERLTGELTSNLTRQEYGERVGRAQEYIAAGDIYQVNLAQQFQVATAEDPFAIYQRLRRLNPAAFSAYLDLGGFQVLSSSPELLARIDSAGRVLTRPIKGTRPRGGTPEEDRQLAAELLASAKDRAELLMIVDLLRNDLGRVCRYGSVQVEERQRLENHPTVHHLVGTISGRLRAECDRFDALRSLLPGGSITGAPKIRAMQIIAELEPGRRQLYTGSIGYLGFDGSCDLNIAIRTIVCREGIARYHVGGGIVADSGSEDEFRETLAKGRALQAALLGQTAL